MMIPEAWEHHESMPDWKRDFYRFHSSVMEPWDGPASIAFTDGTVIGAVLDRNGLRPSRYWVTEDRLAVIAPQPGLLPIDPPPHVQTRRLPPGPPFPFAPSPRTHLDNQSINNPQAPPPPTAP